MTGSKSVQNNAVSKLDKSRPGSVTAVELGATVDPYGPFLLADSDGVAWNK
jgi:hypothetical protein